MLDSSKLILVLVLFLSMAACVSTAGQYRNDIMKQCEEDAELLEMSVEECFDALDIRP